MKRTDLENKTITKLNSIEECLELVNTLDYEECIEVLNRCHDLPSEVVNALINRAKEVKCKVTFELIVASMQTMVNK